jgi:hypothetical protein
MTTAEAPACERHDANVPMLLRTMHSDDSRPDVVVGLYECPECGHERRAPIRTETAAESAASLHFTSPPCGSAAKPPGGDFLVLCDQLSKN